MVALVLTSNDCLKLEFMYIVSIKTTDPPAQNCWPWEVDQETKSQYNSMAAPTHGDPTSESPHRSKVTPLVKTNVWGHASDAHFFVLRKQPRSPLGGGPEPPPASLASLAPGPPGGPPGPPPPRSCHKRLKGKAASPKKSMIACNTASHEHAHKGVHFVCGACEHGAALQRRE